MFSRTRLLKSIIVMNNLVITIIVIIIIIIIIIMTCTYIAQYKYISIYK